MDISDDKLHLELDLADAEEERVRLMNEKFQLYNELELLESELKQVIAERDRLKDSNTMLGLIPQQVHVSDRADILFLVALFAGLTFFLKVLG